MVAETIEGVLLLVYFTSVFVVAGIWLFERFFTVPSKQKTDQSDS